MRGSVGMNEGRPVRRVWGNDVTEPLRYDKLTIVPTVAEGGTEGFAVYAGDKVLSVWPSCAIAVAEAWKLCAPDGAITVKP